MENKETVKEEVKDYIETKIDLIKLRVIDKAGSALSGIISGLVFFILFFLILLFLSISAAYAVAEITEKNSMGFLAIAALYTIVALLFAVLKEKLITMPIINSLLKKYYYKQTDNKRG